MTKIYISATLVALVLVGVGWFVLEKGEKAEQFGANASANALTTANTTNTPETTNKVAPETVNETKSNSIPTNPVKKIMNATLKTNKGDITIEFNEKTTPNTVANFIKLAEANFYDGVKFHRVIKDFMIQGGDPLSKDDSQMARWGTGGPGYAFLDEIGPDNKNNAGTIAMANAGPNTNGSQFFINTQDNNRLDPKHTVFGRVTKGLDVVKKIESTPTDASDRPIDPVIIESITLQ
jgi:cyclophilin family peptidyl-prolyl cis-trans isomerase